MKFKTLILLLLTTIITLLGKADEINNNLYSINHRIITPFYYSYPIKNNLSSFDIGNLFSFNSKTSSSNSYSTSKCALKLNALAITGVLSPSLEIKLAYNFSFQVQVLGVYQPQGFIGTNKPLSLIEFFIEPRYYPIETFRGFFVGLNGGAGYFNMARQIVPNYWMEEFDNVYHKGWNIIGGLTLGWSFNLGTNMSLEPFITTGYTYVQYDNYVNNKLTTPDHTDARFVYAYNGGVNIVYKIGNQSNHFKIAPTTRQFKGSKQNKRFYRRYQKKFLR